MLGNRYLILDVYRFFATLSVTLYHLIFSLFPDNVDLLGFSKYGMWGVIFFFVISGFVITKSVEHKTVRTFIRGRILRLYPAYWILVIFACIALYITREPISIVMLLVNLSMLQEFIGVQHVNEAYWTLSFEILFYFYVSIFLIHFKFRTYYFILTWIILLQFSQFVGFEITSKLLLGRYAIFFLLGMSLYTLLDNMKFRNFLLFALTLCIAISSTSYYMIDYSKFLGLEFTVVGLFIYFFAVFTAGFILKRLSASLVIYLGKCCYPVYFIHSPCIWLVKNYLGGIHAVLMALLAISFTTFILVYIEDFIRNRLAKL